jgi:hypothetical protein
MTRTDTASERGAFKPPPKFFTVKGFQGEVPIEQVRRTLSQVTVALNRAATQNKLRHFGFTDDEISALGFFGLDCGHGSRQRPATTVDDPTAQPASAYDSKKPVATGTEDTATSNSLELEHQSELVPATSLQGGCASSLAYADPMSPRALPAESPPIHSPPAKAGAVPTARKGTLSHFAQPDFEVVRQEFDRNGLSLKLLWTRYRQGHLNKRTYGYSQFCNRFALWAASHSSTALSQGP